MAGSSLFLSERLADIHFVLQGPNETVVKIPAHTQFICAESEPLNAMFYGQFDKPKEVAIPDAGVEDFKIFLSFFYFKGSALTESSVFSVMYLAKKYLVQRLTDYCLDFIKRMRIDKKNALRLLVQAQQVVEVPKRLWDAIDDDGEAVILTDEFLTLEQALVREILKRDSIIVAEKVVYTRLKQWALRRLESSGNLTPNGQQIRQFLGDDLWLVRFAQMTAADFARGPANDELLTDREKADIYGYICSEENRASKVAKLAHICTVARRTLSPPAPAPQLKLNPVDKVKFTDDNKTSLKIANPWTEIVAVKVKCTDNQLFRIRPPVFVVMPRQTVAIQLTFHGAVRPRNGLHYFVISYIKASDVEKLARQAWMEHEGEPTGVIKLPVHFTNPNHAQRELSK